jgi:CheY-like chemotaxis protein
MVLVAEDDPDHRRTICDVLSLEGYEAIEAANGQEALDRLLHDSDIQPPAMVILDLIMPGMTGWELLAARHSSVWLERFPVVLISGSEPQLDPARHGAIDGFLRKPYELDALLETVGVVAKKLQAREAGASPPLPSGFEPAHPPHRRPSGGARLPPGRGAGALPLRRPDPADPRLGSSRRRLVRGRGRAVRWG